MGRTGIKFLAAAVTSLLCATGAIASDDESKPTRDNSRLSIFAQPSISFLSFEERSYFQNAIDTIYTEFKSQAVDAEESLYVAKQNFQKVNFCFPVMGGLQYQLHDGHFLSAGIGFIYDNESVVLTDRKNKAHNYSYTLQGVPAFLEYRLAIPTSLITLSNGGLFSLAVRWYWTLPGTEIYTTWGKIDADNKPWGAGFGVSLGYLIASWNGFNVFGDIGFSSISVESKESFADIVPDGPDEKAKWNIGGLQLQIRVSFGLIKMPVEKLEEKVAKSVKGETKAAAKPKADNADTTAAAKHVEAPAAEAGNDNAEKPTDASKAGVETPAAEVHKDDNVVKPAAEAGKDGAASAHIPEAKAKAE